MILENESSPDGRTNSKNDDDIQICEEAADEKTSKKEKPLLLQSTKKDEEDIEIVEERAVENSPKKEKPLLLPSSKDDNFSAIWRKKPRQKRAVVKWNHL